MKEERLLRTAEDFRRMCARVRADELPDWLLERGRALQWYAAAEEKTEPAERLTALYNGYGALMGFAAAAAAAAADADCPVEKLLETLDACRQEGDESWGGMVRVDEEYLDRLASALRRRLLELP